MAVGPSAIIGRSRYRCRCVRELAVKSRTRTLKTARVHGGSNEFNRFRDWVWFTSIVELTVLERVGRGG